MSLARYCFTSYRMQNITGGRFESRALSDDFSIMELELQFRARPGAARKPMALVTELRCISVSIILKPQNNARKPYCRAILDIGRARRRRSA